MNPEERGGNPRTISSTGTPQKVVSNNESQWTTIRKEYLDNTNNSVSKTVVHNNAVDALLADIDVVTAEESEQMYRYNPDTGVYTPDAEAYIRKYLTDKLGDAFRRRWVNEILYNVKSETFVPEEELQSGTKHLVCVSNGTLIDPTDPVLGQHDPGHQVLSGLPVKYDPEAECPRWEQFIAESVRLDDRDKLQEFTGYLLHHWGQPFKKALLITGPTDSGKSTYLNTVGALLGDENIAAEPLQDLTNTRWGAAQLYGQLANIYPDLDERAIQNPGKFKALTGDDRAISAEFKGQDKFTFTPTAKLLFSANSLPSAPSDDVFHDRFLHVEFPESIDEEQQDPQLDEKLERELSGILNWALDGYQRLMDQDGFTNERSTRRKRQLWDASGDTVSRFRQECLEVTGNPDDAVSKDRVYERYRDWCQRVGETPASYDDGTFSQRLTDGAPIGQCRVSHDGNRTRAYSGCRLT